MIISHKPKLNLLRSPKRAATHTFDFLKILFATPYRLHYPPLLRLQSRESVLHVQQVTYTDALLEQSFNMSLVSGEKSNFQFILRLLNTNVEGKQKVMYALTKIKGVGRRYSNLVCKKADVDLNKR